MPSPQSHHVHSLQHFLSFPVTLFFLFSHTVPTSAATLVPRRIRVNFVTPSPTYGVQTQQSSRTMMFIIFGVLGGLVFLAMCCYAAVALLKAYKRRQVRAANQSINTRRGSTDSIWGIPENSQKDNPYDVYAPRPSTSLGTAALARSALEKETGIYPPIESPHDVHAWSHPEPSPAYHEGGYAGLPMWDFEKSYVDVPPAVPPKNTVRAPRDTTSAIIEDRFGPAVINRSEMRSSYESYRTVKAPSVVRPPRSSGESSRSKAPRKSHESSRSSKASRIKMVPRSTPVPATPLRPPPPSEPMTFV